MIKNIPKKGMKKTLPKVGVSKNKLVQKKIVAARPVAKNLIQPVRPEKRGTPGSLVGPNPGTAKPKGIPKSGDLQMLMSDFVANTAAKQKQDAGSFKKGGKIKKTGMAKVHKGERVLNKKQAKKWDAKKFEKARKQYYHLK